MKTLSAYYSILAVFCIAVLCTGMVSATGQVSSPRHNSTFVKGSGHQGFDLTNATLQQEMLTRYQQQGIDVTGLQTAFQSGNMTDVKEWMKEHHPAPAAKTGTGSGHQGFDLTNTTFQQEMITRYQQQGIDVTGLQTAFQSGNMTEVKEWMKDHRSTAKMTISSGATFKFAHNTTTTQGFFNANRTAYGHWQPGHVQQEKTSS